MWGPKTTALPPELADLKDVDISPDVPSDRRAQVEALLSKHVRAFGVDGRLGDIDASVPVNTKPDAQPVSQPMYAASPAKRGIIENQVNEWLGKEVIEPSNSPWGAPVVVVFRNGKAR
ncbi:hypothetical protein GGF50DRAFT_68241, partial [Schizophyllum commune]